MLPSHQFFRHSTSSVPTLAAEAPSHPPDPLGRCSLGNIEHCPSGSRARQKLPNTWNAHSPGGQPTPHGVATSKSPSHSSGSEKTALNSKKTTCGAQSLQKGIPISLTLPQLISKRVWRETLTMSVSDQPITSGCMYPWCVGE